WRVRWRAAAQRQAEAAAEIRGEAMPGLAAGQHEPQADVREDDVGVDRALGTGCRVLRGVHEVARGLCVSEAERGAHRPAERGVVADVPADAVRHPHSRAPAAATEVADPETTTPAASMSREGGCPGLVPVRATGRRTGRPSG